VEHHLLDHLQYSNTSRHSSRSIRELENTEAIEEKAENEEEDAIKEGRNAKSVIAKHRK
jgi:hypothetical protein